MYRLICQKPAHFLSAQMVWWVVHIQISFWNFLTFKEIRENWIKAKYVTKAFINVDALKDVKVIIYLALSKQNAYWILKILVVIDNIPREPEKLFWLILDALGYPHVGTTTRVHVVLTRRQLLGVWSIFLYAEALIFFSCTCFSISDIRQNIYVSILITIKFVWNHTKKIKSVIFVHQKKDKTTRSCNL